MEVGGVRRVRVRGRGVRSGSGGETVVAGGMVEETVDGVARHGGRGGVDVHRELRGAAGSGVFMRTSMCGYLSADELPSGRSVIWRLAQEARRRRARRTPSPQFFSVWAGRGERCGPESGRPASPPLLSACWGHSSARFRRSRRARRSHPPTPFPFPEVRSAAAEPLPSHATPAPGPTPRLYLRSDPRKRTCRPSSPSTISLQLPGAAASAQPNPRGLDVASPELGRTIPHTFRFLAFAVRNLPIQAKHILY